MTKKTYLKVAGMTCSNCAMGVKTHLQKKGVRSPDVNFATAEVSFEETSVNDKSVVSAMIESLGYKVISDTTATSKPFSFSIEMKFFVSLVFTLPLLLSMFVSTPILHNMYFQLLLTIPVYIIGAAHFGLSAYKSLKASYANMDVLIFTGSTAAFIYSFVGTVYELGHDYMFYETSASIITIVLFGNLIEQRSVKKTTTAIDELLKLQPEKAQRLIEHKGLEAVEQVNIADIAVNDALLVNEGDKVPVDGTIYWGDASVDESMLTGESIPVFKQKGDKLLAGSVVVHGNVKIKATVLTGDTVLSKIIDLVKNAQSEKPKLQNLADKISNIFVPVVVIFAILTFLVSFFIFDIALKGAIMRSIAVLVIACPCALGLAIPTAVVVAVGGMAKRGILIKGGVTIDKFAKIKRIVFDKTGTLTTGRFEIKEIHTHKADKDYIESLLLGIEKYSSHPIAKSIVEALSKKNIKPMAFEKAEVVKGMGVIGWDSDNNKFEVGSHRMLKGASVTGEYNIYIHKNGDLLATVDIEDEIKQDAKELMQFLKKQGISVVMLSGDSRKNCMTVAEKLGIEEVYYEKMPNEKLEIIKKLNKEEDTAMVGDGINDAPALAKAGVGISLSNATHVAVESAQIILLNGRLSLLIPALRLSKKTLTTIKQNLFWAFFYNVLAIPFAAAGFLKPIMAALAMALSDVIVVFNSLRLKLRLKWDKR